MDKQQQTYMDQQKYYADINAKTQAEIRAELTKTSFPFNEVKGNFVIPVKHILMVCSLEKLKVDLEVYNQLANEDFNLFSFSFLLNAVQTLSPYDLDLESPKQYVELMEYCYELGNVHSKHAKPIQEKIQEKYQKQADDYSKKMMLNDQKAVQAKNKKVIPINRK